MTNSPIPAQSDFTDDYAERLENCYSGMAVYDVLRAMEHPNQLLPTTIVFPKLSSKTHL